MKRRSMATANEIGVLTDRQIVTLSKSGRDEERTTIESVYLDQIAGAKIEHVETPDVLQDKILYGIVSLFVGLLSIIVALTVDSDLLIAVLFLIGLGVGGMGVMLLIEAYNTPDDSVYIELQTPEGEVSWHAHLNEDCLEFSEAVSKTVGNAHKPTEQATRKVGR